MGNKYIRGGGFTIVELLIVVVVIAILAAITVVSYNGITTSASNSALKANLSTGIKKLSIHKVENGSFPNITPNYISSDLIYTNRSGNLCLSGSSSGGSFHVTESGTITAGSCPNPVAMQSITSTNCPTERTVAFDVRDNRTYWIQRMPDSRCWMLTNLAYSGGGVNTYGDTKVLGNGTADTAATYTLPRYYVHSAANITAYPSQPSTDTTGGGSGSGRQYGYLYNWCAAMGGQTGTAACAEAVTPEPNVNISTCPAGWKLPAGSSTSSDYRQLNDTINGGSTTSSANLLLNWLGQLGGYRNASGFERQGSIAYYWSSRQYSSAGTHIMYFSVNNVHPTNGWIKADGVAIRCITS